MINEIIIMFHSLWIYDLSVQDHDKTMGANMTRRERLLIGYSAPFSRLLANESLHIINSVDNGINEVGRRKEGLKSLS